MYIFFFLLNLWWLRFAPNPRVIPRVHLFENNGLRLKSRIRLDVCELERYEHLHLK